MHHQNAPEARQDAIPAELPVEALQRRLLILALRNAAQAVALDLPARLPEGEYSQEIRCRGVVITVTVRPAGLASTAPPNVPWTECERDLLQLLSDLGAGELVRFTRTQIDAEFAKRDILHGDSTVGAALARLVRRGLLINTRDHRGYGLPAK